MSLLSKTILSFPFLTTSLLDLWVWEKKKKLMYAVYKLLLEVYCHPRHKAQSFSGCGASVQFPSRAPHFRLCDLWLDLNVWLTQKEESDIRCSSITVWHLVYYLTS